jgi:hypothetical protein
VTGRRGFLGALAALVAAPVMAKSIPKADTHLVAKIVDIEYAKADPYFAYIDTLFGARQFKGFLPQPWSDIRRSAARLRAIRRFA